MFSNVWKQKELVHFDHELIVDQRTQALGQKLVFRHKLDRLMDVGFYEIANLKYVVAHISRGQHETIKQDKEIVTSEILHEYYHPTGKQKYTDE